MIRKVLLNGVIFGISMFSIVSLYTVYFDRENINLVSYKTFILWIVGGFIFEFIRIRYIDTNTDK